MLNGIENYGTQRQIEEFVAVNIVNLLAILPKELQDELAAEIVGLVKTTFKRQAITESEIVPSALGKPDREKVLGIILDKNRRLVSLVAGQLLNTLGKPLSFNGDSCFHISTAHTLPGTTRNPSLLLISQIFSSFSQQPRYLSGFTQSPRIYEFVRRLSRNRIVPSITEEPEYLLNAHRRALAVFDFSGQIENSVFRNKVTGEFYSDTQLAHSSEINTWWQNTLKVSPKNIVAYEKTQN